MLTTKQKQIADKFLEGLSIADTIKQSTKAYAVKTLKTKKVQEYIYNNVNKIKHNKITLILNELN